MPPRTTYEKILADHMIGGDLLFIDLHLVHEVTSPQAFDGLRLAGRKVRRPDRTLATADHNVPTTAFSLPIGDDLSRAQLEALDRNCAEFGIRCYGRGHRRQGIVHVIGPELGVTQPGMTIVCGDSPHLHARRVRRARVRHRHERGRAGARHADAAASPRAADARPLRGRALARRDGEGPDPRR